MLAPQRSFDMRFPKDSYLDIFIYNEKDVIMINSSFLYIQRGIVLGEWEGFRQRLLKQVGDLFASDPATLSLAEIQLRRS
ncbi:hypothetical protein [Mastigocladopsis repens]|uniref:hypothetical protein n=1 Tax=Mastigocladopsis repens TaxID=221287 RepID=UPI0003691C92|nr:hypothetical protein [Mastigocladopsis repens]